jgi:hypothetical protein
MEKKTIAKASKASKASASIRALATRKGSNLVTFHKGSKRIKRTLATRKGSNLVTFHKGSKRIKRTPGAVRISRECVWLNGQIIRYPLGSSALVAYQAHRIESELCVGTAFPQCDNVPNVPWKNPLAPSKADQQQAERLLAGFQIGEESGPEAVDALAGKIAWLQARFQRNGGARRGEIISKGKDKGMRELKMRDGDGKPVDQQLIDEMTSAARASILADLLAGVQPDETMLFRRAKNAAERMRHTSTREQLFDDVEKAARAKDKAFFVLYPGQEKCLDYQPQPGAAEFIEEGSQNAALLKCHIRARSAIKARFAVKSYPRKRLDELNDLRFLRKLIREIKAGAVRAGLWREDKQRNERLANLRERVAEGQALIALRTHPSDRPTAPARARTQAIRSTVTWGTAPDEVLEENLAIYAEPVRILARQRASRSELAGLAELFCQ